MHTLALSAFVANIVFFIAGFGVGVIAARPGSGSAAVPVPAPAVLLSLLWATLEGVAYFGQAASGRRLDIGYVVDHYQLFIVLLAPILGVLAAGLFRSRMGIEVKPRAAPFAATGAAATGAAAIGAAAGIAAGLAPLGMGFRARSEFVFAAWDAASFAVLTAAAAGCMGWSRGAGPRRVERYGRPAASLALLAVLAVELVPRLRAGTSPFYPWAAFIPGAWGAARLAEAAVEHRSDASPRVREPGLADPEPAWPSRGLLTPRELEVARAASAGYKNMEIADRLFISLATVKKHLSNAMEKLDCRNRVELAAALRGNISLSATERDDGSRRSSRHGG